MNGQQAWQLDLGARPVGPSSVRFRVWAPRAKTVAVRLVGNQPQNPVRDVPMEPHKLGYFEATVSGASPGSRYQYLLDGKTARPDPASRFQPDGVHAPSAVVDPDAFQWTDQAWTGLPLDQLIVYELHPGTFTPEGTFQSIIPYLPYLRDEVGITAVELMPVAQFPGSRNWGYDGVSLYAPQSSYGGPEGLKTLVNACHAQGLAVVLDVVYNHLGPEGNYLNEFGYYFTDHYRTPWGQAINYDGPSSDEVRHYVISNAVYWVTEYHIDSLRLDAIHGIVDCSATHVLRDLAAAVHAQANRLGRNIVVVAESDLNDVRVISPTAEGGYGLDGQWSDDFHHAIHSLLTGEKNGYYQDFGDAAHLATALREGFVYSGQHSAYRKRRHGNSSRHRPPKQLLICSQNHDQVGNRAFGDRLTTLIPFEALKVAAATVLFAPNVPLLFMGEEYGEPAPFQYFTDHSDPELAEAVRKGRRAEFVHFGWKEEEIPDPQDPATFERSRVHPGPQKDPKRSALLRWYRTLSQFRKAHPPLGASHRHDEHRVWVFESERVLVLHRWTADGKSALVLLGFNKGATSVTLREPAGTWRLALDAAAKDFGGTGQQNGPDRLAISAEGATLSLPPYAALLYFSQSG